MIASIVLFLPERQACFSSRSRILPGVEIWMFATRVSISPIQNPIWKQPDTPRKNEMISLNCWQMDSSIHVGFAVLADQENNSYSVSTCSKSSSIYPRWKSIAFNEADALRSMKE